MTLSIDTVPDHPASFRDDHIEVFREMLTGLPVRTILDPFAGIGKIHDLRLAGFETFGIEREPEWARMNSAYTVVGDSLALNLTLKMYGLPQVFDAAITSPCFGNRMADHHEAKDDSKRNTYRHMLGRPITEGSSAILHWGTKYQAFHEEAWKQLTRVVERFFILHIKDHVRGGEIVQVTDWHKDVITGLGWKVLEHRKIQAPGNRFGANHQLRVMYESAILFEKVRAEDQDESIAIA